MPGSSASISDATVTQTLLGKFTTTDPDTTCSVTSPVASAYEVRKVTSPANPQQPEFEDWIKSTVTQASIDFNDQTVPLPLTIKYTDGYVANDITGTFNVNIVNEAAAATIHTFNVTDSDDVVTCSTRAPESTFFNCIRVKAGVTLAAAVSPYVMNVDCTNAVTAVSSTFTQPVLDKRCNSVLSTEKTYVDIVKATVERPRDSTTALVGDNTDLLTLLLHYYESDKLTIYFRPVVNKQLKKGTQRIYY
ncbi:hypothetical protein DPMN_003819 [Dreissena polymorpha]|uniref:Uncharacterized protein n=1 Tax=Dreissena polymorpha TaxID=45954 RepID=A0A9D4MQE8_DREPO|nr:hypothetical protein DPMN_003819 [Dreissena polymorpha]